MTGESDLKDYRTLLEKVSAKFDEIHQRNAARMKCGRGCSACCQPDLSVFAVERENIRRLIRSVPGLEENLRDLEIVDSHEGTRCRFLDRDGSCSVYEARPVICRSHGAPIYSKLAAEQGESLVDACPLNFEEGLSALKPEDFVNIDLLNQLLSLINIKFIQSADQRSSGSGAGKEYRRGIAADTRFPLTVNGILGEEEE